MTDNPLMNRRRDLASVPTAGAPTDLESYCAWLNQHEPRHGRWVIVSRDGRRSVDFQQEAASVDWLREKGIVPKVGRAA